MPTSRSFARHLAALAACILLAAVPAAAADYPAKPIRIVLMYGAGTTGDAVGRAFGKRLSEQMNTPVIVETRDGGGGVIGASFVAASPPDGYTVAVILNPPFAMRPLLQKSKTYDAIGEFTPVAKVGGVPMILVANRNAPFQTFAQLVEYAKQNPGKLNYSSSGLGSPSHMYMEELKIKLGIDMKFVPYKSTGAQLTDVMSGVVELTMVTIGGAKPHLRSGALKPLAFGSSQRHPEFPDVPTIVELMPNQRTQMGTPISVGFIAPRNLPADIVDRLNREIAIAARSPDVVKVLEAFDVQPGASTPRDYAAELQRSSETSRALMRDLKMEPAD